MLTCFAHNHVKFLSLWIKKLQNRLSRQNLLDTGEWRAENSGMWMNDLSMVTAEKVFLAN